MACAVETGVEGEFMRMLKTNNGKKEPTVIITEAAYDDDVLGSNTCSFHIKILSLSRFFLKRI